jgi:hypothetical protein
MSLEYKLPRVHLLTGPIINVDMQFLLQIPLKVNPAIHDALLEQFIPLLLMSEKLIEFIDHDLCHHNRLASIDDIRHARFFRAHEGWTEANGQVVGAHLGLGLKRGHVFFEELDDEHQRDEVERGKGGKELLDEFALVGHALIVHQPVEEGKGNDGFLQVGKKFLDEAGNQMWVGDLVQVSEVPTAQLFQGLILLVNGYALAKNTFLQ